MKRVNLEVPPRAGYVELGAGLSMQRGPSAYAEAGLRFNKDLATFVQASADRVEQKVVGGVRWNFGL